MQWTIGDPVNAGDPVPNAPSNLRAQSSGSGRILLGWDDNSNNESGFIVERKMTAGATWTAIAETGFSVAIYLDTGVTDGVSYDYRVRAYGVPGSSAYSNVATSQSGATLDSQRWNLYE